MGMRLWILIVVLTALPLSARTYKTFPATAGSVERENAAADSAGYGRYLTATDIKTAVDRGDLVPVPVLVDPRLPKFRRFVRPETADFLRRLDNDFFNETGKHLVVDSAVRPADVQQRLSHINRNAAPATGARASSHERGTTVDLSRRMPRQDYRWLLTRLMYYRATGRCLVIEERGCLHVFGGVCSSNLKTQD